MLTLLHQAEGSWWYRGRALLVSSVLGKFLRDGSVDIAVDYGAGFGGMYATLKKFSRSMYAFEPDAQAREVLLGRSYERVFNTQDEALARTYDLVALFDVLEHIENDKEFLVRLRDSLTQDGCLIVTVPAYAWLWSEHDTKNHHFRRYTKTSLVRALTEAGFNVRFSSYWNTFLFLPAAVTRLLGASGGDALLLNRFLNSLLLAFVRIEASCIRIVPLPFGLSVVAYATKEAQ